MPIASRVPVDRSVLISAQQRTDLRGHGLGVGSAAVFVAVEEESWGSLDAAEAAAVEVVADFGGAFFVLEEGLKAVDFEAEFQGQMGEVEGVELALMAEEQVVHFPETPLRRCSLGGLGGGAGVGVALEG